MCWGFGVVGLGWYLCCRLKHNCCYASACNTDTTPTQSHRNSNPHRTKNHMTDVVIQQNSRKLLMMDILMSETCWAHKKWNKMVSDIKLVFYSSIITVMHGPINMRLKNVDWCWVVLPAGLCRCLLLKWLHWAKISIEIRSKIFLRRVKLIFKK